MPLPIDPLRFLSLTVNGATTNLADNLTFCTIINNGDGNITISQSGDSYAVAITIAAAQGISFQANDFEVLPILRIIAGSGTTLISVMY
tara:strand:+ start:111 stop:377 length:267 start_codon:yes stop_codon:yes gene_type:complete